MSGALKSGDQNQMNQIVQHGKSQGLSDWDLKIAQGMAASGNDAATVSKDTIYDSSPQGVRVQEDIGKVHGKIESIASLLNNAKKYKTAAPYSKDANDAEIEIEKALRPLGKNINDVKGGSLAQLAGVGGDLGGLNTTAGKYEKAALDAKQEIQREIQILKSRTSSGASTRVATDIKNLEETVRQLDILANSKTNIMTGTKSPPAGSQMVNFMKNGVQPATFNNQPSGPMQINSQMPQGATFAPGALPPPNPTSAYRGYGK